MSRVVGVVQARMGSQRLPGKVLARLPGNDAPDLRVLDWTVQRLGLSRTVDAVVVATSSDVSDDPLVEYCVTRAYDVFRGSLADVLDRFHGAARAARADVVVRVTADCPLIDPAVVDLVVDGHLEAGGRFTANRLPPPHHRTYPIGLDVEVTDMSHLELAWREATQSSHREHVMPYLYEHIDQDVLIVDAEIDAGDVRWTIDTVEDLRAVRGLIEVADARLQTTWQQLLAAWRAHPELAALNGHVQQRRADDVDPRSNS
jgi:spore coat polysaccharide biosynthesis protein SpsF